MSESVLGIYLSRLPSLRPSPNRSPRGSGLCRGIGCEKGHQTPQSPHLPVLRPQTACLTRLRLCKMGAVEHTSHPKVVHRGTSGLERMPARPGITAKGCSRIGCPPHSRPFSLCSPRNAAPIGRRRHSTLGGCPCHQFILGKRGEVTKLA